MRLLGEFCIFFNWYCERYHAPLGAFMQYRAALFFVFRLIAHDRRDCLAVLDFSGIDHFTQLIDRICIDIDKFILVQMLMGRL